MKTGLQFTRVFKNADETDLNKQTVTIAAGEIAMVRASNRLGYPEHRSTLTLKSGLTVEVAEISSKVTAAVFSDIKDHRAE